MKTIAIFLVAGLALFSTGNHNRYATISQTQDTLILGKLYFINLKEGEKPVMTALSLFGNRCGSESFNNKPCSTDGIRSVFELDEWIEFHTQATTASGIKVMVFKHRVDQGYYPQNTLNEETPGYILECDLNKDPNEEETSHWGSFYLHPEEVNPGYYDFVFVFDNKVFATMLTHFYQKEELVDKSDSELEELME